MSDRGWLSSLFASRSEYSTGHGQYELVVLEGEQAGESFPLSHDRMLIGRRTPNPSRPQEICLRDRSVSLRQATLEIKRGRVFIEHLPGATNHTIVNRHKVSRKKLKPGDIIVLGLVVLELRKSAEAAIPDARVPRLERTTALEPAGTAGQDAFEGRPPDETGEAAETWLDLEPADQSDSKGTRVWSPTPPTSQHADETVIDEPTPPRPKEQSEGIAAPVSGDQAATIVQPPPPSPPAPVSPAGHDDETIIDEPADPKTES